MAKQWKVTIDASIPRKWPAAGRRGLLRAGEEILAASQKDVPFDTGELSRSGYVEPDGDRVAVGYRDPKAAAAHENMTTTYGNGRSAKFLERAFNEHRTAVLQHVKREIDDA